MYPDLSYFFHDLFGTEVDNWTSVINTFGFFLALTFVCAFFIIRSELRRKHAEGIIPPLSVKVAASSVLKETIFNALVGFVIGFKVPYIYQNFGEFKGNEAGMVFSKEGSLFPGIIVAVLFGLYAYFMGANKPPRPAGVTTINPADKSGDIILYAAIFGVIGSRLFSILENLDSFWADPMGQLLSGSGLTIYGGLILAFIVVFYYIKRLGIPPLHMMDISSVALAAGYGVGRMGCQFSGDGDWGIENTAPKPDWFFLPDWVWAYDYPRNVADFHQRGPKLEDCIGNFCTHLDPPVFPTPIYEIVISFVIFTILWSLRKNMKTAGKLFFLYLFLSSFTRFWVEAIRVNPRYDILGLGWSQAQWISAILVVVGLIGFFLVGKKESKPDFSIPDLTDKPSP